MYPREIPKEALRHNATAVFLVHNHPSGSVQPSLNDRAITLQVREALSLVDIRVWDHVIVAGTAAITLGDSQSGRLRASRLELCSQPTAESIGY